MKKVFGLIVFAFYFKVGVFSEISDRIYAIGPQTSYFGYVGTFATISAAIASVTAVPLSGNMIFEFQPDYVSTIETYPILLTSSINSNAAATITFRPAASVNSVINFSPNGQVINNTGADYIIFDGRNGGTGNNKYLQFTAKSGTTSVITWSGDTQHNQILYSILKGYSNTAPTGNILAINSPINGNNFYTIDHCDFDASGSANNCLYTTGVATDATITNNNFFNFQNGAGVNLVDGSNNAVIDNNSFYQTTSYFGFAGTTSGIIVGGGNNVRISNNNIGGNSFGLIGTWKVSKYAPAAYNFIGISATSLGATGRIYNNKIQNFDWTSTLSTWTGMNVSGTVNVGTDGANYIGNSTGNDNIKISYSLADAHQFNGIVVGGAALIENNIIGSITTLLSESTSSGASFTGINSSGTGLINHNTIGSTVVSNSINTAPQSTSMNAQNVYGIYSTGSTALITNNTIANINNGSTCTTGFTRGIFVANNATSATIKSNDIHTISTSQPSVGTGSSSSLDGINIQTGNAAIVTITSNTIYNLVNNANAAVCINGILYNSSSITNNRMDKNYIHSFVTSSNLAIQNGINLLNGRANVQNNAIRLGIDKDGNSITSTAQINGIVISSGSVSNFCFNTVYIGGAGVVSGSVKTYALNFKALASNEESFNNIFINMRTSTVANKLNYAVLLPTIGTKVWNSDYNIYNTSATDGILGNVNSVDVLSLRGLQESCPGAELHSGFGDPSLNNPTAALAALDLCPASTTEAEATGVAISGITDDITGAVRSSNTPTDIGAYSGHFTQDAISRDIFSPAIIYTNLGNVSSAISRSTSNFATITDNIGGLNVTPGTKPRLYFRTANNANAFVGNTSADNGWKWVEASGTTSPFDFNIDYSILYGGPVALNTVILYFVVAQNQSTLPTVSFNPSKGASGTSVTPVGMTVPTAPNSYTIVPSIQSPMYVGTGQTYTTLTGAGGAFATLNKGAMSSNTVVIIKSDITEPGIYSLNQVTEEGTNAGTLTLTIQSNGTSHVISGTGVATGTPMISINGAKRLIIDGGDGGTGKLLTFRNTNSTPSYTGAVFQFNNSSQNDILTNCIIESNIFSSTSGSIKINSNGVNNVTIDNNDIRDARGGTLGSPLIGIYSSSSDNTLNIKNNNIYNLTNPASYGIYLIGTVNGSAITGNNIYMENAKIASGAFTGIQITTCSNLMVSGNHIGGSSPNCGGTPFAISGSVNFSGISCTSNSIPLVTIQGNTIQNISMTSTSTPVFYGIYNDSGPVIITGNIVGSATTDNSIQIAGTGTSAGIFQRDVETLSPCTVEKNTIANISLTNTAGSPTFSALKTNGGIVRMNNVFNIGSKLAALTPVIYGINNVAGITNNEFSNNVISLNGGAATALSLYGFFENSSNGSTGFFYNSINLYGTASGNSASYAFYRFGSSVYVSNNNIIINSRTGGSGVSYAVYSVPGSGLISDFNDYYAAATLGHWGSIGTTNDVADMAAWRGVSSQDANSISIDPLFTTATNLLPLNSSPVNGSGTPVSAATTDITGALRNLVAPTVGAYELICVNPVGGGTIAADQSIEYSTLPALITSTLPPSGFSGRLEYKWQSAVSPFALWTDVFNSNLATYQPGVINQTTHFKRLVRTMCMTTWEGAAESNVVTISVNVNKWRGTKTSNNWNDPSNWTLNRVPATDANIVFDDTAQNDCQLNSDISVNDITNNQSSYHLLLNGKALTIKGALNFRQVPLIDASTQNSIIEFSGTTSQNIPSGTFVNDKVYNLTINNNNNVTLNGSLNLLDSISTISGKLDASTNLPTVIYGGLEAQDINSSSYLNDKVYNLTIDNSTGVSLVSDFTVGHSLTINSGKHLTIYAGKLLNVDGTINNNAGVSGLLIKADMSGNSPNGSLIFHNTSTSESCVPATVEMYTKAAKLDGTYKWQFFGIPLKSVQANPTFSGSYIREMFENVTGTTDHWVSLNNESVLTSFTGYEITQEKSKIIVFQGNLENINYGPVQLSYTSTATYKGQHLIGNPYLAAINIRNNVTPANSLTFGEGMDKTVYLYNTGSYNDWASNGSTDKSNNDGSGQYLSIPRENAGNDLLPTSIPSMQAFLVMVKTPGSTATIAIPYSSTGAVVKNTAQQRASFSGSICTRIDVKGSNYADRMWIFTTPACTRGFDNGWDGRKLFGSCLAPQIYAMEEDGNYQVNAVDDINNTILGFKPGVDTVYTLTFTHQNKDSRYQKLYLMDLTENKTIEITNTGSQYTFNSGLGVAAESRFKIIANNTTEVKSIYAGAHSLIVFSSGNAIFVNNQSNLNGNLYLYDLTGRFIKKFPFYANTITTLPIQLPVGSYLSKAFTSADGVTSKLIFR